MTSNTNLGDHTVNKMQLKDVGVDEVLALNRHQNNEQFHAFTCPNRNDGEHRDFNGDLGALVATRRGWICPWCDYTQDWAHSSMMEVTP